MYFRKITNGHEKSSSLKWNLNRNRNVDQIDKHTCK